MAPNHTEGGPGCRIYTPRGTLMVERQTRLNPSKENSMCSPAPCNQCSKVTWTGCGEHIEEALAHVPEAQRCTCR